MLSLSILTCDSLVSAGTLHDTYITLCFGWQGGLTGHLSSSSPPLHMLISWICRRRPAPNNKTAPVAVSCDLSSVNSI
jgi:hypothetical protein